MQDVEAVVGPGAVRIVTGTPDELDAAATQEFGPSPFSRVGSDSHGWVLQTGGGAIGLQGREEMAWEDYVVDVAEVLQEAVIEGAQHWGAAFPPCPEHPNHPMDAKVIRGIASWVCPLGSAEPIPIGTLGLPER